MARTDDAIGDRQFYINVVDNPMLDRNPIAPVTASLAA